MVSPESLAPSLVERAAMFADEFREWRLRVLTERPERCESLFS